jgi:hypothetical protein
MTKSEETTARQLMDTLAQLTELFRHNAVTVGKHTKVSKTLNALEFTRSTTGPLLTGYLDAELKDGTALSWLLDVAWTDESWSIQAKLARSTRDGQDTIQELPGEEISGFEYFRSRILDTTRRLLALRAAPLDV